MRLPHDQGHVAASFGRNSALTVAVWWFVVGQFEMLEDPVLGIAPGELNRLTIWAASRLPADFRGDFDPGQPRSCGCLRRTSSTTAALNSRERRSVDQVTTCS
jgi:hypothetical protein